jgi:hypothetical protein
MDHQMLLSSFIDEVFDSYHALLKIYVDLISFEKEALALFGLLSYFVISLLA